MSYINVSHINKNKIYRTIQGQNWIYLHLDQTILSVSEKLTIE